MLNISRGSGIFNPQDVKHKLIHIIGLGNIGSHTALALTRMGFENFALYDFDVIEDVNISTQAFDLTHEGSKKIEAVAAMMKAINPDCKVKLIDEKLTGESKNKIVSDVPLCFICGVDSLSARKKLKKLIQETDQNDVPIIDGRLGKQQVEVLYANNASEWNVDVDDNVLAKTGCTEKYIAYTPLMCAALISGTVKKMCLQEPMSSEVIFEFESNSYLKK